jgi:carotenoid cleavage dioxygenase-like enzyme
MDWYTRGFISAWLVASANGLAAPKTASEYPGFNTWLTDNVVEVEPTPMEWENDAEKIPTWLKGTYMKIGPAKSKFGDDGREYQNMVDGWAKINKFVVQDGQMTYSSGFINCTLYQDFADHERMTPHTVLGKMSEEFESPDLKTFVKGAQIENDNVTIEKMKINGKAAMIASTDSATVNQFDKDNFDYQQTIQTAPLIQDPMIMAQMLGINEQEFINMLSDETSAEVRSGVIKNPVKLVTIELCKSVNKAFSFAWEEVLRRAFRLLWNRIQSRVPRGTFGSCAHWKKRPGQTDNFLNYGMSGLLLNPKLSLYQFTDGGVLNDSGHRELLGEAMIPLKSLIHEFSVTPNYAIFFCYPVTLDFSKVDLKSAALAMLNEHETLNEIKAAARERIEPKFLMHFFEWGLDRLEPIVRAKIERLQPSKRYPLQDLLSLMNTTASTTTQVVVFDLNERRQVMSSSVDGFYGTHHVNAFEASDGTTLVCDVVHAPNDSLQHYTDKKFLRNYPVDETKFTTPFEIQRYTCQTPSRRSLGMRRLEYPPRIADLSISLIFQMSIQIEPDMSINMLTANP